MGDTKELKGWINDSEATYPVSFEIYSDGMVDARLDGEIWDYSSELDDFVSRVNDRIYTERIETDSQTTYGSAVKLSEWFKKNGAKAAHY